MNLFSYFDPNLINIEASLFENLNHNGNGGAISLINYQNINMFKTPSYY